MTIICIKDRKIAWDSQISMGTMKWGSIPNKVKRVEVGARTYFIGGCGAVSNIQAFMKFVDSLDDEQARDWFSDPHFSSSKETTLFVYDPQKEVVYEFEGRGPPVKLPIKKSAWVGGTGQQYAYGVMDAGKSAYEAVKMVIKRYDGCGEPIHTDEYKPRRRK